jgi:hypothetical protein
MNATSLVGGGSVGNLGPSWHVEGDSSPWRNGNADLLWQSDAGTSILLQNDNGGAYIWQSNGTAVTGSSSLGNPGPSWHIKAEGDFYGDGNPNILRQNVDGAAHIWETNGTNVLASASLANLVATWHV